MISILGKSVGAATGVFNRMRRLSRRGRWPLTLGVRVAVLDDAARVLLVRHTYAPGWHFPGGAVDPRETMAAAALRELREEALVSALEEPAFQGVYLSLTENKSDHIGFFVVRRFEAVAGRARVLEIAEAAFFPVDDLPKGTTGGTRRRLAEVLGGAPRSPNW